MDLQKNNNKKIIYKIAQSNLQGRKLYSIFISLTIALAVCLVCFVTMFISSSQTAKKHILSNMHHVIFDDVSNEVIDKMSEDSRIELLLRYKHSDTVYKLQDKVKFNLVYIDSSADKISTYVPVIGNVPEKANEIVVDKKFMEALGKDAVVGEQIELVFNNDEKELFTVSGYIDNDFLTETYTIYVSREFADKSKYLKDMDYCPLVRINSASLMSESEFKFAAYSIGADYGIEKAKININGTFLTSLSGDNSLTYIIVVVCIVIFIASAVVAYNIFYISVSNRIQQLGQLQSIGMTEKQIKKMIKIEGLLLSYIAIPIGIIISGVAAYMAVPKGWSFKNFIIISLVLGILELIAVQFSISKPANEASKVSPIEALRNTIERETNYTKEKPHKTLSPWQLAKLEQGSNKKKLLLMTVSLAIGGVLFMVGATYMKSWDKETSARDGEYMHADYLIMLRYDGHVNPKTYGYTDLQLENIMTDELINKFKDIPNVREVNTVISTVASLQYKGVDIPIEVLPIDENNEFILNEITDGQVSYEKLIETDGIAFLSKNIVEELRDIQVTVGDNINLLWFDGTEREQEMQILGTAPYITTKMRSNYDYDSASFAIAKETMDKMWGDMNKISCIKIKIDNFDENNEAVEEALEDILKDYPNLVMGTFREQRLISSTAANQITIIIYGFSIFLIIFSLLNLINTVISNIMNRRTELAMLESIGMEVSQIKKMFRYESIFIALPNFIITVTLGTALSYLLVWVMVNKLDATYLVYSFPIISFIIYIVMMLLIPIFVSELYLRSQNKISLTERIKYTD